MGRIWSPASYYPLKETQHQPGSLCFFQNNTKIRLLLPIPVSDTKPSGFFLMVPNLSIPCIGINRNIVHTRQTWWPGLCGCVQGGHGCHLGYCTPLTKDIKDFLGPEQCPSVEGICLAHEQSRFNPWHLPKLARSES